MTTHVRSSIFIALLTSEDSVKPVHMNNFDGSPCSLDISNEPEHYLFVFLWIFPYNFDGALAAWIYQMSQNINPLYSDGFSHTILMEPLQPGYIK